MPTCPNLSVNELNLIIRQIKRRFYENHGYQNWISKPFSYDLLNEWFLFKRRSLVSYYEPKSFLNVHTFSTKNDLEISLPPISGSNFANNWYLWQSIIGTHRNTNFEVQEEGKQHIELFRKTILDCYNNWSYRKNGTCRKNRTLQSQNLCLTISK